MTALALRARPASTTGSAALAAFAVLCASAVLAATVGEITGASHANPHHTIDGSAAAVGWLILHNAGVALIPLGILVVGWDETRGLRNVGDVLVAVVLVVNGVAVGWAFARAGLGLAAYLPHLPLEWVAIAIGAGTWLAFRREAPPQRRPALLRAMTSTLALLALAAVMEAYLVPVR